MILSGPRFVALCAVVVLVTACPRPCSGGDGAAADAAHPDRDRVATARTSAGILATVSNKTTTTTATTDSQERRILGTQNMTMILEDDNFLWFKYGESDAASPGADPAVAAGDETRPAVQQGRPRDAFELRRRLAAIRRHERREKKRKRDEKKGQRRRARSEARSEHFDTVAPYASSRTKTG